MPRKSMLDVLRLILKVLRKNGEMSLHALSLAINSQWETTEKAVEFLVEIGIVQERKGPRAFKEMRLFRV